MNDDLQEFMDDFLNSDTTRLVATFVAGVLLGALAGSGVALLTAPQSGKATRKLILHRSAELRDQALDSVDDAREQARRALKSARDETRRASRKAQKKAQELQDRSQDLLERVKN